MWVLIVVNVVTGSMVAIPGYSSIDTCSHAAGDLTGSIEGHFKEVNGKDAHFTWKCLKPS